MNNKIFYDKDADLKYLKGRTVGIIGYGIQGRAQALNMRDSGLDVIIANRKDPYASTARKDGFRIEKIGDLARKSDIVMMLIPDQAQPGVYEEFVRGSLRPGSMLVFAHGYTLRYRSIKLPKDIDVAMLAPRMPGYHIRHYFQEGGGVPAFIDVAQDSSGAAKNKLLALAKAAGFTRAGVLSVSYKVETDLDLFTEQFLVAAIVRFVQAGFKFLVDERKYPAVPVLMELYASGELAEVLKLGATYGIGGVFQKNASPTCQFGIASSFDKIGGGELEKMARTILRGINNGSFRKKLDREGNSGYPQVSRLWKKVDNKKLVEAQEWINKAFKTKGKSK